MELSSLKLLLLATFENANVPYTTISLILAIAIFYYYKNKPRAVYLLDYACFKPPPGLRVPAATFVEHSRLIYKDNPKAARFQARILERAGLGEETALPVTIQYIPPEPTMELARDEAHLVIFSAIDELLAKTGLGPKDIGILITNCSIFCPVPSLTSMIMNKYKMRSSIKSFSLSGMGCSASPISVDLAHRLLQVHPNSYALVVSFEIITPNCYLGLERPMLVPGCLFRVGCTAGLLTNKRAERRRAKYKLLHLVRVHRGPDDVAYGSVTQEEDGEGNLGISLSKDLMVIAGEALESNITALGPLVLPVSEKARFAINFLARKAFGPNKVKPYVPSFNKVFDHFCIHAGGRAVIDELEKALGLSAGQVEASRMTLHRFGNTSSSSIWYELSYIEAKGRMKRGDRVWQIAFGSGFKCNSAVWMCNRDVNVSVDGFGPWRDCVDKYPVLIHEVLKLL